MREALIINEIKNGNKKELANIYKTYRAEFINWATTNYKCNPEEARDIYQASIIVFYDNILKEKLLTLSGSVKTYLFAIGKNKILELRRSDKKFDLRVESENLEIEDVPDFEKTLKETHFKAVQKSLEKLGEPCRTMLEFYYFHNNSMEELAHKLGYKNAETVKNLKCRCLMRLRELVTFELKQH